MSNERKSKPQAPSRVPQERPGQVGGTRDSNRRERTRALLDAALALFLQEGIERVTIDQIALGASMAKGGFYRYFSDKEDLVTALFAPLHASLAHATDQCSAQLANADSQATLVAAYEGLAAELALTFLNHKGEVMLYLQECRAPGVGARRPVRALADELAARAIALTQAAHVHGLLRPFPPEITALGVVGATERLVFALLAGENVGDPFEMTRTLVSFVLDGVRNPQLPMTRE